MSEKDLQSLTVMMKELSTKFDGHVASMEANLIRLEKLIDGKASGWVEWVTKGAVGLTLSAVLLALLGLVVWGGAGLIAYSIATKTILT